MKTITEFAAQAARETRRWYGQSKTFAAPQSIPVRCEDFWMQHWRRFPQADPTGGQIIDGDAFELHGFLAQ